MSFMLLGTKLGMTRYYTSDGASVPVTVVQVGPCVVTQIRTKEVDGYSAVQLAYGTIKARNSTQAVIAHDAKAGSEPKRFHREFRCTPEEAAKYTLGQVLTVNDLADVKFVDLIGTTKGKGFQGTMKRHHFKGMFASHGTERKHRSPGSIGSLCSNRGYGGGLAKGKRMAGHMGHVRATCRSLDVVKIDAEAGLALIKGSAPGPNRGMLLVRKSTRLYKTKSKVAAGK